MIHNKVLVIICIVLLSGCKTGTVKPETVQVYKYDGSVSCDQSSAISIEDMKQELMRSKIPVISSSCGNDGMVRAAVCGIKTGNVNIFEVSSEMYPKARALGFQPVSSAEDLMKVPCR